jgi:signal transduction histidine kinase
MSRDAGTVRPAEFPDWACWVALGVFAALIGVGLVPLRVSPAAAAIAAVTAIGGGAWLAWHQDRRYVLPGAAVATAGIAVAGQGNSTNLGWLGVCLIGLWCALTGARRDVLLYWAATVILFAVEWLWVKPDPGWGAWIGGTTFAVTAGLLVRRERDLVAQLSAAQAGLAERARAAERNRIAGELHDVIAHTLTVSLLHVTSARLAVEHNLEDAARSLAEAERLGRESLDEVRTAVGMLHQDGPRGLTSPLPGADGLPTLIDQFRSAGADATFTVDGDTGRMSAITGLALYRILQEALTNAIKHAAGARAAVHVTVDATEVRLTVDTAAEPGTGTGFGVLNMRERARSAGGYCAAGPGGHGWLVRAEFPLDPGRRREELA